jgi:FkbM family methyltransferase
VFAIHGYFDWRLVATASFLCRKGDTIIEVGANVGTETLAFADIVGPAGRVHAFEPFPGNLQQLREVVSKAGLSQVRVVPAAVADTPGFLEFSPPPDGWSGSGHLVAGSANPGARDTIKVETTTLDAHFRDEGTVRLISIDAEGAETTILGGAHALIARDQPVIVVEAEPALLKSFGSSLADLKAKLESFGYRVHTIGRMGLNEPETASDRNWNWVALPPSRAAEAEALSRHLFRCAVLPWVPLVHPMAR